MVSRLADLAELAGFSFKTSKFWQVKLIDPDSPWLASSGIPGREVAPPPPKFTPRPWKEASSLIIAAHVKSPSNPSDSNSIQNVLPLDDCDYRLLMAKRSGKSSYMANAYVFPGGYVELADFSPKWWAVFEAAGMPRDQLVKFGQNVSGNRPPIFTEPAILMQQENLNANVLPSEVALRITAIRETFEEAGLLLLNRHPSQRSSKMDAFAVEANYDKVDIRAWKKKVHDNPICFAEFCLEVGLCPDIWALKEWWNWLTPQALGHKRFDTMFYVACLDYLPEIESDDKEMSKVEWFSPLEMLEEHTQKRAVLAPPQVYELCRLSNYTSYEQLVSFTEQRESKGIERWCATITGLKDGALLALPGDDYFEKGVEVNSRYLPTLEEIRVQSKCLNRIELRAPTMTALCNVTLSNGHDSPISYPHVPSSLQAHL